MRKIATVALMALAGCVDIGPEQPPIDEFGWETTRPGAGVDEAGDDGQDTVYAVYAEIEPNGGAAGVVTVMGNRDAWGFDPYRGLLEGFAVRDAEAPFMIGEFTREIDGARCRLDGSLDELGVWSATLSCGGETVDTLELVPTTHGYVTGQVTTGSYSPEYAGPGIRVAHCPAGDLIDLYKCRTAGYTTFGGAFSVRVPEGEWFMTFAVWGPILEGWEWCRPDLQSDEVVGRTVNVARAQAIEIGVHCPWFTS